MINYEPEYKQCLEANRKLREENANLKRRIDKLRMDLSADE
jgi:hypothetical protein